MTGETEPSGNQGSAEENTHSGAPTIAVAQLTIAANENRQDSRLRKRASKTVIRARIFCHWLWRNLKKPSIADWFVAAATVAMALTSACQWRIMGEQTFLMRRQLAGTMAAIVKYRDLPNIESPATGNFGFNMEFENVGHVIARNVTVHLKFQMIDMNTGERIGKVWDCDPSPFEVAPDSTQIKLTSCYLNGVDTETWKPIEEFDETLAVDGTFHYEDGFEDVVPSQKICFRYEPKIEGIDYHRFETCERFSAAVQQAKDKKTENQQKQPN